MNIYPIIKLRKNHNVGNILHKSIFVIDRLHIKNHVRKDCHTIYNADLHNELFEINSVVCEEVNYWFGFYKHAMKHMNNIRFNFFKFVILDLYETILYCFNSSSRYICKAEQPNTRLFQNISLFYKIKS